MTEQVYGGPNMQAYTAQREREFAERNKKETVVAHKVILINAAGTRTEHEFATIEHACGACGPKMPLIFDGRAGYFEMWPDPKTEAVFVETDEDFIQFKYAHLPAHLQAVSKRFYELAEWLVLEVPAGRQRSVALLDLLRAKDAAVRARLAR